MEYYIFSDEAGSYKKDCSFKFCKSHPFFIRSNVMISIKEYREFQSEMHTLNERYRIPTGEEIKWSDIWESKCNRPRTIVIKRLGPDSLKEYCTEVFNLAFKKQSLQLLFTITRNEVDKVHSCMNSDIYAHKYHFQDAFQRIQMDLNGTQDFATFIIDDLNNEDLSKKIKEICHEFTEQGDRIREYANVYHGVLVECSTYSVGIQLADYIAGVMNGYLKNYYSRKNNYEFARELFEKYLMNRIRSHFSGTKVGYGICVIPSKDSFRDELTKIFDNRET